MTELTTERLEKFLEDIENEGMCDITDSQVESALRELLTYRQTAKNQIAWSIDAAKAQGRIEGINFAAGRLAAAFNHGFVDKPVAEVGDVVRMILGAKEEITSYPAEDGLSGEYAEQSLKDWEQ
ncbi:hypothetical protein [Yersinia enterocolitica]